MKGKIGAVLVQDIMMIKITSKMSDQKKEGEIIPSKLIKKICSYFVCRLLLSLKKSFSLCFRR